MWKNYQESPPDRFDLSAFEENAPGEEFDFSVELRSYLVNHSDKSLTPAADHAHLQFLFYMGVTPIRPIFFFAIRASDCLRGA
jgi:hypothetical protein